MNHQLCNQMLYKVLHHKNNGIEKFLLAKKKKNYCRKTERRCLSRLKALVYLLKGNVWQRQQFV